MWGRMRVGAGGVSRARLSGRSSARRSSHNLDIAALSLQVCDEHVARGVVVGDVGGPQDGLAASTDHSLKRTRDADDEGPDHTAAGRPRLANPANQSEVSPGLPAAFNNPSVARSRTLSCIVA